MDIYGMYIFFVHNGVLYRKHTSIIWANSILLIGDDPETQ
jgi:hypothetical protein